MQYNEQYSVVKSGYGEKDNPEKANYAFNTPLYASYWESSANNTTVWGSLFMVYCCIFNPITLFCSLALMSLNLSKAADRSNSKSIYCCQLESKTLK